MKYYAPAWSIIYWLLRSSNGNIKLNQKGIRMAITAHSMALLLHPLDDHLNDGQVPASHLTLLLRSQAWMIMNNALNNMLDEIGGGHEIVNELLDHYYSSIDRTEKANSLNDYCELFRKQMATWLIIPVLLAKSIYNDPKVSATIQSVYESFGIAWRLLDDINDIQTDMIQGSKSSIHACLPEDIQAYWDKGAEDKNSNENRIILDYILKNSVIEIIKVRICHELDSAASAADDCRMKGWGDEFRCLSKPLIK